MFRITVTHVRSGASVETTTTVVSDAFAGAIGDLAARVAQCRAAAIQAPPTVGPDAPADSMTAAPLSSPSLRDVGPPSLRDVGPTGKPSTLHSIEAPEKPRQKAPAASPVPVPNHAQPIASAWTGPRLYESCKDDPDRLRWYEDFGRLHGYPRRMLDWSPVMATQARAARYSPDRPIVTGPRRAGAARP